jgi:hypothetical protein
MSLSYIRSNSTKIMFMAAVFSFLAVSIPHVSAIFRVYEPAAQGLIDVAWNLCSVGAATGIDVLAGWLTLVMMSKQASGRDKLIIWTFIIALMVFSWYCNWLFDMMNSPMRVNVWNIVLFNLPFVGVWSVQQLTPLVVSALPVFIVAYASIAHLVGVKQDAVVFTLDDLKQQAKEAEERAQAELTIIAAQAKVIDKKIETRKATAGKALTWGKQKDDPQVTTSEQPGTLPVVTSPVSSVDSESIEEVVNEDVKSVQSLDSQTLQEPVQIVHTNHRPVTARVKRPGTRKATVNYEQKARQLFVSNPLISGRELGRQVGKSGTVGNNLLKKFRVEMAAIQSNGHVPAEVN